MDKERFGRAPNKWIRTIRWEAMYVHPDAWAISLSFWKGEWGKIRNLKRHRERDEMIVGPLSFLSDDPKNEKHSKH
jgi:hypothetical protein